MASVPHDNHVHDEHHDHDHDETVLLEDENGNEREFRIVDVIEVGGKEYAVLVPEDEPEGDGVVLRIDTDADGEEYLVDIEDDAEWDRVVQAYEAAVEEDN
ncbi:MULTISPECIES: DUF1292 domain-containing protein [Kyrpidia]|nr:MULTISPECIES: DUF1292 domain-containing protein [Kyrpidia]MCL6577156.1 DUF1292 domain-containing protein [Kyrpidia sp.]HHY67792.1 DUF1292 domain-containing protein [Alicyclobacillus sp.]